jgi:hypothetical protein
VYGNSRAWDSLRFYLQKEDIEIIGFKVPNPH